MIKGTALICGTIFYVRIGEIASPTAENWSWPWERVVTAEDDWSWGEVAVHANGLIR